MQSRTVNDYEIVGNKYIAIVISTTHPNDYKCFERSGVEDNAFILALYWAGVKI